MMSPTPNLHSIVPTRPRVKGLKASSQTAATAAAGNPLTQPEQKQEEGKEEGTAK
jgi:hypothetical protein